MCNSSLCMQGESCAAVKATKVAMTFKGKGEERAKNSVMRFTESSFSATQTNTEFNDVTLRIFL